MVCAGNPPEYNRSVYDFDVVTLDRLRKIAVGPDLEAWARLCAQNRRSSCDFVVPRGEARPLLLRRIDARWQVVRHCARLGRPVAYHQASRDEGQDGRPHPRRPVPARRLDCRAIRPILPAVHEISLRLSDFGDSCRQRPRRDKGSERERRASTRGWRSHA